MARKSKSVVSYRRKKNITIPIAIVAGFAPTAVKIWESRGSGASGMAREAGRILTGVDFWNGSFNLGYMRYGALPIAAGFGVHWLANKFGLNRAISRAGIPFIRV